MNSLQISALGAVWTAQIGAALPARAFSDFACPESSQIKAVAEFDFNIIQSVRQSFTHDRPKALPLLRTSIDEMNGAI